MTGFIYEACQNKQHADCTSPGCECVCHEIDDKAFQEAHALTGSTEYAMEYARTVSRTEKLRSIREHRQQ